MWAITVHPPFLRVPHPLDSTIHRLEIFEKKKLSESYKKENFNLSWNNPKYLSKQ